MANLFTFGCSYTQHRYPTYANWLATYFDRHYQFGMSGNGNRAIMGEIGLLLTKKLIKPDDLVIIQWTGLLRDDRIVKDVISPTYSWNGIGFDKNLKDYDPILHGIELISYLNMVLPAINKYTNNVRMFYMVEPWIGETMGEPSYDNRLAKHYKYLNESGILDTIYELSKVNEFIYPGIELNRNVNNYQKSWVKYTKDDDVQLDGHPTPHEHFEYSRKIIKRLPDSHKYDILPSDLKLSKLWDEYILDKDVILRDGNVNYHDIDRNGPRWPNINKTGLSYFNTKINNLSWKSYMNR